jgi:FtsP/CotA-like multicopper oxidase with cupredoxin domain
MPCSIEDNFWVPALPWSLHGYRLGKDIQYGPAGSRVMDTAATQTPVKSHHRSGLHAGRHPERLDAAPFRMNNGVKEFHLVAEPVEREMAEGMTAYLWGYNGQSPGPTIEAVEGDRVRIFVTNKLPEHTTIHWHGMILPSGMDGVGGLSQPHIPVGKTFVYEFDLVKSGTFMYHPHSDEMVQMAMGMMGFFVDPSEGPEIHACRPRLRLPAQRLRHRSRLLRAENHGNDRLQSVVMEQPGVFPGIDPLVVSKNDRVRVRVGNLTMTNHPIHMHGYDFEVTCTDGGWVRPEARWPEVSIDIPVGAMRAYEFDAKYVGDWAIHCHKSHHTMNAMGHDIPTFIGVDKKEVAKKIRSSVPNTCPWAPPAWRTWARCRWKYRKTPFP